MSSCSTYSAVLTVNGKPCYVSSRVLGSGQGSRCWVVVKPRTQLYELHVVGREWRSRRPEVADQRGIAVDLRVYISLVVAPRVFHQALLLTVVSVINCCI